MVRPIELEFVSRLGASAGEVWAVVSTMQGVNAELRPLATMTFPAERGRLDGERVAPGRELFRSWILLGGVLPIDRHRLALVRIVPGIGFDEESSSWLQRRWRHERRVMTEPTGGCVVRDRLVVEPRRLVPPPLVAVIVGTVFRHRHRRLRSRFERSG